MSRTYLCLRRWLSPPIVGVSPRIRSGAAAAPRPGQDSTTLDDQVGAGRHGLQLRHRARARRAQPPARARELRPEVHGHRRDGEPGDRSLPLADRAVAASASSSRTTSTTCSSRRSCCASTSAATSRSCGRGPENGTTREEEVKAHLLSYNNGPVWRIGNEIVTGLHADHIRFPELPGNLYTRPTLIWTLENSGGGAPSRGGVLSGGQAVVERGLRAHRRARRQGGRSRRVGHADQRQRHGVPRTRSCSWSRAISTACARRSDADATDAQAHGGRGRGADGAGGVLRLPPVHPRAEDDDQQQRDQAGEHAGRHRRPGRKRYVVDGQAFYYRNAPHPGAPLKDVVQVYYQFKNEQKAASACRCPPAPSASTRRTRRAACNSSAKTGSITRRRTKRSTSRSATPSTSSCERKQTDFQKIADQRVRDRIRDHAAQPQVGAGDRRGQRADRRHVANAALVARVDEVGRLGRAVHGAGGLGGYGGAEIPCPRYLLKF